MMLSLVHLNLRLIPISPKTTVSISQLSGSSGKVPQRPIPRSNGGQLLGIDPEKVLAVHQGAAGVYAIKVGGGQCRTGSNVSLASDQALEYLLQST